MYDLHLDYLLIMLFQYVVIFYFRQCRNELKASTQRNDEMMQIIEETSAQLKLKVCAKKHVSIHHSGDDSNCTLLYLHVPMSTCSLSLVQMHRMCKFVSSEFVQTLFATN